MIFGYFHESNEILCDRFKNGGISIEHIFPETDLKSTGGKQEKQLG